jgi:hypothetical protein
MPSRFKTRYAEEYLVGARNARKDSYSAWKNRISAADITVSGGFAKGEQPSILNLADKMPRDAARLASEVKPSYYAPPVGDTKDQLKNASLRTVIGEGYFTHIDWPIIRPQLVFDIVIAGAGFVAYWTDPSASPYPLGMRIDPRGAFPTIYNGKLLDLLVCTEMKARVAQAMFPTQPILAKAVHDEDGMVTEKTVEVYEYYAADECVRAWGVAGHDGQVTDATVVSVWRPSVGVIPVSFFQLPSPDGAIRGLLDQVEGNLKAKDELVKDVLEVAAQAAYAPFITKGVINADTPPGPDVLYQLDPSVPDAAMQRVQPATFSPQIPQVLDFIDQETRGQLSYPATRQGEVPISQGSGAFVAATQGDLTSLVREVQRGLQFMQEQGARVMFALDEAKLDFEKPLFRSSGRKKTYVPSRDIHGHYELQVSYGAGAGLDRMNTDVRLLNYYSAGLIPGRRVLAETDFVDDAESWLEERQDEELERVALQRFAGDPTTSLDFLMTVLALKREEGLDFVEAYTTVMQEMQSQQPAAAGAQGGMLSPDQAAAPSQEGLAAGAPATPPAAGGEAIPGQFSPQPLQQVFVK